MPKLQFTEGRSPDSEREFRARLREAVENGSPVEDLIRLTRELTQLELKHSLTSAEFYERFQHGELGDDVEFVRWVNKYEFYQRLEADMVRTFDLLEQYAFPAAS